MQKIGLLVIIMKLFLAGPFFSDGEVERLERVKAALEAAGFEVYSTSHRNARINLDSAREKMARFRLLCGEIRKCDGLFAVLDGRDPGTIWEMGYAFATGKPVIAFCENDPFFSLMIDGSAACLTGLESIDGRIAGYLRTDDVSSMPKYQVRDRCDY
jgi:nucleoside 2-deoxyribosyltransferase